MGMTQLATRIDADQVKQFRETTDALGTTPADAIRMFIKAFNRFKGFPFPLDLNTSTREELLASLRTKISEAETHDPTEENLNPALATMFAEDNAAGLTYT